jgi:hypothetical protein
LVVLALLGYLGSYAIFWGTREETMFVMTADGGCITKRKEVSAIRSGWIQSSRLEPVVTFAYWPLNALRNSQAQWR